MDCFNQNYDYSSQVSGIPASDNPFCVNPDLIWEEYFSVTYLGIIILANGLIKLDIGQDSSGAQVFPGWNNLGVIGDSAQKYWIKAKFNSISQFSSFLLIN